MRSGAPGCLKIGLIFGEGSVKAPRPCRIPAFQRIFGSGLKATGSTHEKFRVGDLELDSGTVTLRRVGEEIALPKLSFELLLCLARHAPNVVTTDTLMDEVWGKVVVGEETVKQRVKLLRKALGDDSSDPRYIAAVRGRGYRLLAEVSPLADEAGAPAAPQVARRSTKTWLAPIALLAVIAAGFLVVTQNNAPETSIPQTGEEILARTRFHRQCRGLGGLSERACRLPPLDPAGQRDRTGLLPAGGRAGSRVCTGGCRRRQRSGPQGNGVRAGGRVDRRGHLHGQARPGTGARTT